MRRGQAALLLLALGAIAAPAPPARAADTLRREQWNLDLVRRDAVPATIDGGRVLVAVLDTGVDATHPDLIGQVRIGPDLVDGSGSGTDINGHGTHVAGIIAAIRDNERGIEGVAPGAEVLTIRVLDGSQAGRTDSFARGVDAAVAAGARVINLSLGPSPAYLATMAPTDPLPQAMQRAVDAGVVVVAAAGNNGRPLCEQPTSVKGMLCVEAVDQHEARASYSNYGVRVDLVAPGGDTGRPVLSTRPGDEYGGMVGTSQATPHVAAAAALLVSLGVSGPDTVARLKSTARDLGVPGEDFEFGAGLLDLHAAVGDLSPAPAASTPEPVTTASTSSAASLHATGPRRATIAGVLRHGVRVRCEITPAGKCTVRALTKGGTTVLRGARRVPAGKARTVTARPTRAGKALLRRSRELTLRLTVSGAGRTSAPVRLTLRRS